MKTFGRRNKAHKAIGCCSSINQLTDAAAQNHSTGAPNEYRQGIVMEI